MALGENLEDVPRTLRHYPEDLLQKVEWHLLVEQVAHRVHEHPARLAPPPRLFQAFRVEGKIEAVGEVLAEALGDGFGVAVLAAGAHFVAADCRIPGLVCPLYRGASARHGNLPRRSLRLHCRETRINIF